MQSEGNTNKYQTTVELASPAKTAQRKSQFARESPLHDMQEKDIYKICN